MANALKNFAKLQIKSNPDFYVFKNGFVFYKKIHNAVIKDYYKLNYYGKIEGEITENTKTVVLCVERYDVSKSWKPYIKKTKDAVIPYTYMKGDENIKKSFKNDEVRKKNNKFMKGAEGEEMQQAEDADNGYIDVAEVDANEAEGGKKKRNRSKKHKRKPKKYTKKRKFTKRRKIVRKKTKKRY